MNLKNKSIVSYCSLILPVLAIVLTIVGGATVGLVGDTFPAIIVTFLVLGAVANIAAFVFSENTLINETLGILAVIFYGLALGFILRYGIEVLTYSMIGIDNNVGGQSSLTVAYLVLGAILLVLSVVSVFFHHGKRAK